MDDEDFYEKKILPNLDTFTSTLRVDLIQQNLLQQGLITPKDDQALRLQTMTAMDHASHFLNDLLKDWPAESYEKFCRILVESAATYPPHKTIAQKLDLPLPPSSDLTKVPSPTLGADEEATQKELRNLAKVLGGGWIDFALDLAPDMFQVQGNISDIQTDTRGSSSVKAQTMLEMWRNEMNTKATRRLLIEALCSNHMRRQACDVFGDEVTNIVSPQ